MPADRVDTRCHICTHADQHGWWGDTIRGLTHCRGCHASWPIATDVQHCTGCHRTFTNARAADAHRQPGTGHCLDPTTLSDTHGRPRLVVSERTRPRGTTLPIWALPRLTEFQDRFRVQP